MPEYNSLVGRDDVVSRPSAVPDTKLQSRMYFADAIPETLESRWLSLSKRAIEPNIFYDPALLMTGIRYLETDNRISLFTLWNGEPLESELTGLMPICDMPRYSHWPLPHVQNWKHPNCFLGTPLVAPGHEHAFWAELLAHLDGCKGEHGFLHLNGLVEGGPLLDALQATGKQHSRPVDIVHREERAFLENVSDAESYYTATVRSKKRKELRRLRNRLNEEGSISIHDSADSEISAASLAAWTNEFLTLEKAGWKGKNDSALACMPETQEYFKTALAAAHDRNALHLVDMRLDGKPIAMLVNFKSGRGGFSFKTTFDENYARYSPGVLLQIKNLSILQKLDVDWVDSCAAEGHPMIDSLWSARRKIVRVSVSLNGPKRRAYFTAVRLAESSMTYVKSLLRKGDT